MDWTRAEVLTFYGLIVGAVAGIAGILIVPSRHWRIILFVGLTIIISLAAWILHFGGQNPIGDWTRAETLTALSIVLAATLGMATILGLSSRRWRIGLYIGLVVIFLIAGKTLSLTIINPPLSEAVSHFSRGKQLMAESNYFDALRAFKKAFEAEELTLYTPHKTLSEAYYCIGICGLKLSDPDCAEAQRMFVNIQPDTEGLGQKLLEESQKCGCTNMHNLAPLRHLSNASH